MIVLWRSDHSDFTVWPIIIMAQTIRMATLSRACVCARPPLMIFMCANERGNSCFLLLSLRFWNCNANKNVHVSERTYVGHMLPSSSSSSCKCVWKMEVTQHVCVCICSHERTGQCPHTHTHLFGGCIICNILHINSNIFLENRFEEKMKKKKLFVALNLIFFFASALSIQLHFVYANIKSSRQLQCMQSPPQQQQQPPPLRHFVDFSSFCFSLCVTIFFLFFSNFNPIKSNHICMVMNNQRENRFISKTNTFNVIIVKCIISRRDQVSRVTCREH